MSVSPVGEPSSVQEVRQLSTAKDNLLDVKDQMDFSNVDPDALLSALDRLHSADTRQITPRDGNALQQDNKGGNEGDVELSAIDAPTPSRNSVEVLADEKQVVQQKKCCVIL